MSRQLADVEICIGNGALFCQRKVQATPPYKRGRLNVKRGRLQIAEVGFWHNSALQDGSQLTAQRESLTLWAARGFWVDSIPSPELKLIGGLSCLLNSVFALEESPMGAEFRAEARGRN